MAARGFQRTRTTLKLRLRLRLKLKHRIRQWTYLYEIVIAVFELRGDREDTVLQTLNGQDVLDLARAFLGSI